jgi:hypothetical protein
MPAFTFEKISPPVRRGPAASAPKKPRGVISQMIDRFAEKRAKGAAGETCNAPPADKPAE